MRAAVRPAMHDIVRADQPAAYWRFEDDKGTARAERFAVAAGAGQRRASSFRSRGRASESSHCSSSANRAAMFEKPASLRYDDPERTSPFDFAAGDSITLEAWVSPAKIAQRPADLCRRQGPHGQQRLSGRQSELVAAAGRQRRRLPYLVSVSRCRQSPGRARRLAPLDERRWLCRGQRLALCRGERTSSAAAIRFAAMSMAGRRRARGITAAKPMKRRSSMTIRSGSARPAATTPAIRSLAGLMKWPFIARRCRPSESPPGGRSISRSRTSRTCRFPSGTCSSRCWKECRTIGTGTLSPPTPSERFTQRELAFVELPKKYNSHGVIDDRSSPFVLWAHANVELARRQAAAAAAVAECGAAVHRRQARR